MTVDTFSPSNELLHSAFHSKKEYRWVHKDFDFVLDRFVIALNATEIIECQLLRSDILVALQPPFKGVVP